MHSNIDSDRQILKVFWSMKENTAYAIPEKIWQETVQAEYTRRNWGTINRAQYQFFRRGVSLYCNSYEVFNLNTHKNNFALGAFAFTDAHGASAFAFCAFGFEEVESSGVDKELMNQIQSSCPNVQGDEDGFYYEEKDLQIAGSIQQEKVDLHLHGLSADEAAYILQSIRRK